MSEHTDETIESEAQLVEQFLLPLTDGDAGTLALRDDCAVLSPPAGMDLLLTTDSLVEGVHFLPGDVPSFKALAVNVSDLVAKGAQPLGYLLTLAFPSLPTRRMMTKLTAGLASGQAVFGCHLLGGDTDLTGGLLTLTIAAIGAVPAGKIVRRAGAKPGDVVYVSGTIGDSTLGLALRKDPSLRDGYELDRVSTQALLSRFETPRPPVALAPVLRQYASAALDVSDGLAKDFLTLCRVSEVGGEINLDRIPLSAAARRSLASGRAGIGQLVAGGEDYEVLATVPKAHASDFEAAAAAAGVTVTAIGRIVDERNIRFLDAEGNAVRLSSTGWEHL